MFEDIHERRLAVRQSWEAAKLAREMAQVAKARAGNTRSSGKTASKGVTTLDSRNVSQPMSIDMESILLIALPKYFTCGDLDVREIMGMMTSNRTCSFAVIPIDPFTSEIIGKVPEPICGINPAPTFVSMSQLIGEVDAAEFNYFLLLFEDKENAAMFKLGFEEAIKNVASQLDDDEY